MVLIKKECRLIISNSYSNTFSENILADKSAENLERCRRKIAHEITYYILYYYIRYPNVCQTLTTPYQVLRMGHGQCVDNVWDMQHLFWTSMLSLRQNLIFFWTTKFESFLPFFRYLHLSWTLTWVTSEPC